MDGWLGFNGILSTVDHVYSWGEWAVFHVPANTA